MTGADTARLLDLTGRVALVTGGGGAIGSACAGLLMERGASVISVDLEGRDGPSGCTSLHADLADPDQCADLVKRLDGDLERLDCLVHCAGITRDGVSWKLEAADWRAVMACNLDSAFHLLHGLLPLMRRTGGGAVVLVGSINGERGKFGQANYAASKAGLIGLARSVARESGRFQVRVNVLEPGLVETPMTAALDESVRQRALEETVLGRFARAEDVACAALFLCSDMSRHVTGQVLRVDGGQLMA